MSAHERRPWHAGRTTSAAHVGDLYRHLAMGEVTETSWMGSDRETLLWLLANGDSIPVNHLEKVAGEGYSRRIEDESAHWMHTNLDRCLLAVIAALATADLLLGLWFAHVLLGWF